ncbi:UvrD-helicase domain-containing protein [Halobacillus halophilus]|uniref:UvrD-helicase domain-containing protein n=1 Tax=Halobacillus halophilus TaxID=1570 RepID=UPI001CD61108|nr:ATP-dependent helicase [Halobacillus halophilus]MCA1011751.1 ATP-dependent helicase [Halobacillus halophilus]
MIEQPQYSILIYQPELEDYHYQEIARYLSEGIKVYVITMDPIDPFQTDDFFKKTLEYDLLRTYEILYSERFLVPERWIDGKGYSQELIDFFDESSAFNKQQYIVEHFQEKEHLIIKASAGTGKTTVMLDRLMFLKHTTRHVPFREYVLITFTNKAANDLREKLLKRLSNYYDLTGITRYLEWMEELNEAIIGTIHSFAKQFIGNHGDVIGYFQDVKVRSYIRDKKAIIKRGIDIFAHEYPDIYSQFRFIPHYLIEQRIYRVLAMFSNKALHKEQVKQIDYGMDPAQFNRLLQFIVSYLYDQLDELKKKEQAIEVDDLISRLTSITSYSLDLKDRYRMFMVDEFQDTDDAQISFIKWLASTYNAQLLAVGDTKQSIYRFRGADYTAFEQLIKQMAEAGETYQELSLRKNYRTQEKLLDMFDQQFQSWQDVIAKFRYEENDRLIATKKDDVEEDLVTIPLDDQNLSYILRRIHKEDTCILARSNRHVQEIVDICEGQGFFCEAIQPGAFYRSVAVREFYLLLRRFTHPHIWKDRMAFHLSSYGERKVTMKEMLASYSPVKKYAASLLRDYDQFPENDHIINKNAMEALEQIINRLNPADLYRRLYYKQLRKNNPQADKTIQQAEALVRMKEYERNLEKLLYILRVEFDSTPPSLAQLEVFLRIKMNTDTIIDEAVVTEEADHRIKVMTVHQAKGLEFDYVILPKTDFDLTSGFSDRMILDKNDNNQWSFGYHFYLQNQHFQNDVMDRAYHKERKEQEAEETRLLYVALTRTKKTAFVHASGDGYQSQKVSSWKDLLSLGGAAHVSSRNVQ